MDAVAWAQIASPLVAAVGIVAVVGWATVDRRRAEEREEEFRRQVTLRAEEDYRAAERAKAADREFELMLRVSAAFERHQAGDPLAAAECRAVLLALNQRLPVTRLFYLGLTGWQPDDASRIDAIAGFYQLPIGADLVRHELRHELQGTPFMLNTSDGGTNGRRLPARKPLAAANGHERRQLTFRLKRASKHAKT